jgi:hypothetical protein
MQRRRRLAALGVAAALLGSTVTGAAPASAQTAPAPWAKLTISSAGNGYHLVVVDGRTAANVPVGVRVYGDDEWFDDFLFGIVGYGRSGPDGSFNLSKTVHRSVLNEDWGEDEIYAIADAASTIRTNTIRRSF